MSSSFSSYIHEAFQRNLGLISPDEQRKLAESRVAVPGMGGVGGSHLITMARCGVGKFHVADFDVFEPVNANRQYGAKASTMGANKLDTMAAEALDVNPGAEIEKFSEGVTKDNLDRFLAGVDVVLDGLDFFALDIRRALFNRAVELGIPVITAGPLGFSSALLVFAPGGPNFDNYFDIHDDLPEFDKYLRFLVGLSPKATQSAYVDPNSFDLARRRGPSSIMACQMCSALTGMEAVRLLLGRPGVKGVPHYHQFDLYRHKWVSGRMPGGNKHPLQRLKLAVAKNVLVFRRLRARPPVPLVQPAPAPVLDAEVTEFLLDAGVQAPSGDNAQPWKFAMREAGMDVLADFGADESFFNVRQSATLIACGAAAENMAVAATCLGLGATVATLAGPQEPELAARVDFVRQDAPQPDPLHQAIWQRITNRKPFRKDALEPAVLDALRCEAEVIPGGRLHLLTDRKDIEEAAELVYQADRIRTAHRGLHEHFMSMVRFSPEEVLDTRDGLPLKNLQAGLPGELFLKATRSWSAMQWANRLGMGKMIASVSRKGMLASGAVGLVTVPGMTAADFVNGGRALQRVWLRATLQGLEFQPMTAITLFKLRWDWDGPEAFDAQSQDILRGVWPRWEKLFPAEGQNSGLIMLFRLGQGPKAAHGTYRKLLEASVQE